MRIVQRTVHKYVTQVVRVDADGEEAVIEACMTDNAELVHILSEGDEEVEDIDIEEVHSPEEELTHIQADLATLRANNGIQLGRTFTYRGKHYKTEKEALQYWSRRLHLTE